MKIKTNGARKTGARKCSGMSLRTNIPAGCGCGQNPGDDFYTCYNKNGYYDGVVFTMPEKLVYEARHCQTGFVDVVE